MEGKPERVNELIVERGVERGECVEVGSDVKEETKRKAELDLSREALGFAACQQTRGKRDDDRLTGCIEKAGSSA